MKISVIGAGVMGARVTEVLIKGGHDVVMIDTNRDHATGSLNRIVADLAIGVEKGKLTKEESDAALARITISNMCSDAAGSALVLECINEHLDDKVTLLKQLDTPFWMRTASLAPTPPRCRSLRSLALFRIVPITSSVCISSIQLIS